MTYAVSIRAAFLALVAFVISAACVAGPWLARPDDLTGLAVLPSRLLALALPAALIVVAYGLGRAIAGRLSLAFASAAEGLAFSIAIGTGTLGLCLLALGLAGWLTAAPVAALLLLVLIVTRRELSRLVDVMIESVDASRSSWMRLTLIAGGAVLVLLLVVRAATPPHGPDEAIYHLPVVKAFVEQGRVSPAYDNFSGNLPLLLHMLYAVCVLAQVDIGARVLSLALAFVTALAIYAFCARFLTTRVGIAAMFAWFGAGMVVEVAVTTRVDVSLAGFLFLTAYAMMIHLHTRERGWLDAAALLAGFSLGIKYTAAIWLLPIGAMLIWEERRRGGEWRRRAVAHGLRFTVIAAVIVAPWLVKNAIWLHNPIYPFFTGELADTTPGSLRFFGPDDERRLDAHYADASAAIPEIAEARRQELAHMTAQRVDRHPFRVWEYVTDYERYNMAEPRQTPNYLFAAALLVLIAPKRRWLTWLAIIAAAGYLGTVPGSWIGRYLLPAYVPLTIVSAYAVVWLAERIGTRRGVAAAIVAVVVSAAVLPVAYASVQQIHERQARRFLVGALSRRDFMYARFYYPPLDYINRYLPSSAKLLMIGAQMGYDLKRPYLAEGSWDTTVWRRLLVHHRTLDEVHAALQRDGVTHVVYFPDLFRFTALMGRAGSGPSGARYQTGERVAADDDRVTLRNWVTFEHYRCRYLELVYRNGRDFDSFRIYRLRPEPIARACHAGDEDDEDEGRPPGGSESGAPGGAGRVLFTLKGHEEARRVAVAGSFNGWNLVQYGLARTPDGWMGRADILPGRYVYKFIVDEHWMTDPANPRIAADVSGYQNSVLIVP